MRSRSWQHDNAKVISAGYSFILFLRECYPINVLTTIKNPNEVCTIYCATANAAKVVIAESQLGRGIMGLMDWQEPQGVEGPEDIRCRITLLRKYGCKRV
ncbi:MAG TPA: adenosine-specific kinase [Methanoregula sp.]|nr:adenosine-specific kinase [Methanoregula sp.]